MTQDAQKSIIYKGRMYLRVEWACTAQKPHNVDAEIEELRDERKGLEAENEDLKAWKESAMKVFPDYQAIGKLIGTRLGGDVKDEIIPFIERISAENARLKSELDKTKTNYMKDSLNLIGERDRLKSEVSELRPIKDQWVFLVDAYDKVKQHNLKTIKTLEARLAEAMRVLEWIAKASYENSQSPARHAAHEFLQSPTNSEAQEMQRAKDKVIEAARILFGKHGIDRADFYRESGNSAKGNLADSIKALDSLPSEAKGGCEHDNGFTYQKGLSVFDKDDKGCPFCDKKTGGV